MNEPPPKTIDVTIHLAVDSHGNWVARGCGFRDEFNRRDEILPLGGKDVDDLGHDDRTVEWMQVCVEVPLPVAKVVRGRLFS